MTKKEVTYTPEQMRAHAIALYAQCDDPAAHNHVIARIIRQGADAVAENAKLKEAIGKAFTHIDTAMGDTDPQDEYDPLLLASQALEPFVGDAALTETKP